MEGRSNNQLNRTDDTRRARAELTTRVEGLAQEILDHIASNPQPPARAVRGRTPSRSRTGPSARRSVSFSSICGCPGIGCSSGPGAQHPPAYSELNPAAPSFTPARSHSRNTARRSRTQGGSTSTVCRPRLLCTNSRRRSGHQETVVLDSGSATPLLPPDHFVTSEGARDSEREKTPPPPRVPTPRPAVPTPPRYSPSPPRVPSPILEPDTSHIGGEIARERRSIALAFRVNIGEQFSHETGKIEKSYDYSCSCLNRKSNCTCSEATLEVSLKVRYHLVDRLRHHPEIGGNES
jgi:hypothetical protein